MPLISPRASSLAAQGVPLTWPDVADHLFKLATALNKVLDGKINSIGTVTLTANAATTTLSDPRIGRNTILVLIPTTANAAAALGTTYQTYPNAATEAAVLNHANNAQTDKTFAYVLLG